MDEWEVFVTDEVRDWITALDDPSHKLVVQAIDILAERGPALGRPLVDRVEHSSVQNLKELRPGSQDGVNCGCSSCSIPGGQRSC